MTTLVARSRTNPYVGPRPFEYGQTLYGRDREIIELRDLLIAERIVLLYAPSGAGKTSLIRAGLVPHLEEEGFRVLPEIRVSAWLPPTGDAGVSPNRYLMSTLLSLENGLGPERRRPGELAGMGLVAYLEAEEGNEPGGEVLIFDQFEELLTADPIDEDAKYTFVTELGTALRNPRRWALLVMREDMVAGLDPYRQLLPTRLRTTFRLDLLGEAAARAAIREPARKADVSFDDEAVTNLVNSLRQVRLRRPGGPVTVPGPYIEPVQLQVVCEQLWEQLDPDDDHITESDVEKAGDVDQALADYYAAKIDAVARETGASERAIRAWFERALIAEQDMRIPALAGPLDGKPGDEDVLGRLEDAHLIRAESRGTTRRFELAHDRLIDPIRDNNAAWRKTNLQPFQRQAPLWQTEFQPERRLLTGDALAEADRWVEEHPGQLEPVEREFLTASHTYETREIEKRAQEQTRRSQRILVATALVTVVVFAITAFFFFTIQQRTLSRAIALEATLQLGIDPAVAVARALDALDNASTPEAQRALTRAVAGSHVRAIMSSGPDAPPLSSAEFSPDGRIVVTVGADGIARTWDTVTGNPIASFGTQVRAARFSPDESRIVTASFDNTARVWDAQGRESLLRGLRGHTEGVLSARWSPDGSRIATASLDGTALVWDAETGQMQRRLNGHDGAVLDAAWSPDGNWIVTTGQDARVRVWDSQTGVESANLPLPTIIVTPAMFSPDGEYVAVDGVDDSAQELTYLWDWRNGGQLASLRGSRPEFSREGNRLLTVSGQTVIVWAMGARERPLYELEGHVGPVTVARFNEDGTRIVSGSDDGTARIWDVASGAILVLLRGHQEAVNDAAFSPVQPDPARPIVVTAGADGTSRVWEPSIGLVLSGYPRPLNSASFSADGSLVVGAAEDGVTRVWSSQGGEQLAELGANQQTTAFSADQRDVVTSAAFSPNGRYVVTGGTDGTVRVWDWRAGQPPVEMRVADGGELSAVAFDPSGRLVLIAGPGNAVRLWEWDAGTPPRLLGEHDDFITDAVFSPDGARVVTASVDRTARIWDVASGRLLQTLTGHAGNVYSAEFSPDGRYVVTASDDRTARIWDVGTGREVRPLEGHRDGLQDAAFSPGGGFVVTGSSDGTVGVWEVRTGLDLALLPMHREAVSSVQFNPRVQGGESILTASLDRTARISECEICVSLEEVRRIAEDRQRYVADRLPGIGVGRPEELR